MNLIALAESDLAMTVEDSVSGGATEVVISDFNGNYHLIKGIMGDIGYLLDTEGNAVSGRSVVFAYRLSSLIDSQGSVILPIKGWGVAYTDLHGKNWNLCVSRVEPDRSLGVCRLVLCLGGGICM